MRSVCPSQDRHCLLIFFIYFEDMKKQFVYDPLISKRQQYLLATQVCTPIFLLWSLDLTLGFVAGSRGLKNRSVLWHLLVVVTILMCFAIDDVIVAGQAE